MSLNGSHVDNGVLIHSGETIILFSDDVCLKISGNSNSLSSISKKSHWGKLYLTTHRMIFNKNRKSSEDNEGLLSLSFPFVSLKNVTLEQPLFSANYIKGIVVAQPNGNFEGEAGFELSFKCGGAIDFGSALLSAASMATRNYVQTPPPYTPPSGPWYAAPPPAYSPDPSGYEGWSPPSNVFPNQPPANSVYMEDAPPPYPGITTGQSYSSIGGGGFSTSAPSDNSHQTSHIGFYSPSMPTEAYVPAESVTFPYPPNPPSYKESNDKKKD